MNRLFSASSLVKSSSRQLKYRSENSVEKPATQGMQDGERFQTSVAERIKSLGIEISQEKRGMFSEEDIRIFFCVDIITDNAFIEVKSVRDENDVPLWYLESSILQVALYKSLIMQGNINELVTPKFLLDKGEKFEKISVDTDLRYLLVFGDRMFNVVTPDSGRIVDFYLSKIESLESWESAKEWDERFKFREFEFLREVIGFKEIDFKF